MIKLLIFIFCLSLLSCNNEQTNSDLLVLNSQIMSIRPQLKEKNIIIFKLKNKPLLTTVKNKVINNNEFNKLKDLIVREQDTFKRKLNDISDEIKVLHTYKFVLNGMAAIVPKKYFKLFKDNSNIVYIEQDSTFDRLILSEENISLEKIDEENTSVSFIGATQLSNNFNLRGQGMRVGVIDSGIDYTHSMFNGVGDSDVFSKIDPSLDSIHFPNEKVVGGIDLVGSSYNANSVNFNDQIPRPDNNPIDEGGHGTHVAGSIAGVSDNNSSTYAGVAPDATLYAIKVFGKNGSTGAMTIIAALEYAADPDKNLYPDDMLDIVNLSLGSSYGKPSNLYSQAIKNLVTAGTILVASAGNSGDESYIVGAPGTENDSFSIAAGIDNMTHNYQFQAAEIIYLDERLLAEMAEASFTKPLVDFNELNNQLIYVGEATEPLSNELKKKLNGKIALIDRGGAPFFTKINHAKMGGAIAAVVINNKPGTIFTMGSNNKLDIPAIMIKQEIGAMIKNRLINEDVLIDLVTEEKIVKDELIDTLTSFSSRGPRSFDAKIKPEIVAPGQQIVSAAIGSGHQGRKSNGTSMSAPHMAGAMALMRQAFPDLLPAELKSIVMNTAKPIKDTKGIIYPVSQQGAGRVQLEKAIKSKIVITPAAISLGETQVSKTKVIRRKLKIKNITRKKINLTINHDSKDNLLIAVKNQVTLLPNEVKQIDLVFKLLNSNIENVTEVDGRIYIKNEEKTVAQIPFLAVVTKKSKITSIKENSSVKLYNEGVNTGDALVFNLLGKDLRKPIVKHKDITCDLQSVGYRQINKTKPVIQFALKMFNPLTRWESCDLSVLIDTNNDQIEDFELAGSMQRRLPGFRSSEYKSLLLNAELAKVIRSDFEVRSANGESDLEEDYSTALIDSSDMNIYNHSTIAILEVDASLLELSNSRLNVLVVAQNTDSGVIESDDYLGNSVNSWRNITLETMELPEIIKLKSKEELKLNNINNHSVLYYPHNATTKFSTRKDLQQDIIEFD
jgi:minor extracellular serine protease Vpr